MRRQKRLVSTFGIWSSPLQQAATINNTRLDSTRPWSSNIFQGLRSWTCACEGNSKWLRTERNGHDVNSRKCFWGCLFPVERKLRLHLFGRRRQSWRQLLPQKCKTLQGRQRGIELYRLGRDCVFLKSQILRKIRLKSMSLTLDAKLLNRCWLAFAWNKRDDVGNLYNKTKRDGSHFICCWIFKKKKRAKKWISALPDVDSDENDGNTSEEYCTKNGDDIDHRLWVVVLVRW